MTANPPWFGQDLVNVVSGGFRWPQVVLKVVPEAVELSLPEQILAVAGEQVSPSRDRFDVVVQHAELRGPPLEQVDVRQKAFALRGRRAKTAVVRRKNARRNFVRRVLEPAAAQSEPPFEQIARVRLLFERALEERPAPDLPVADQALTTLVSLQLLLEVQQRARSTRFVAVIGGEQHGQYDAGEQRFPDRHCGRALTTGEVSECPPRESLPAPSRGSPRLVPVPVPAIRMCCAYRPRRRKYPLMRKAIYIRLKGSIGLIIHF